VADVSHFVQEHLKAYNQAIQAQTNTTADERSLATARWIEEIGVSVAPRRWAHIVKEVHGWQVSPDQTALVELLQSNTKTLESNVASFVELGEQVKAIGPEIAKPILDASASLDRVAQDSQARLHRIDDELLRLSNFVNEIKRLYNGMIPLFIRRMFLRVRRRG